MSKKVLVIDDDIKICALLSDILKENDYVVSTAKTTEEGWDQVIRFNPDVILLDVEVPLKGGLEFCREIKSKEPFRRIPVIFLTVRDQEMDRVSALNLGGDDFISKPFRQQELMARIQVALRRSPSYQSDVTEIRNGGLFVDFGKRIVKLNQKPVHITPKEMDILQFLYANRHRVVSDREVFEQVWGAGCGSLISTVYTHINRIRKKLKDQGSRIVTVSGVGFRYEDGK